MRRLWVSLSVVVLSCALGVAPWAGASPVTAVTIDPVGARDTGAYGINDGGQIVGYFNGAGATVGFLANPSTYAHVHGYLRAPGGDFATVDVPNATDTHATGINNGSQIVGRFEDARHYTHAF
ncbi:MAG TPA: hypothetical protein VK587_07655, partial [bacterium]|nr:hypothetical protein [bacterium]